MSADTQSVNDYQFPPEQADAIFRVATVPRLQYHPHVISFSPCQHDGIRQSISTPFRRTANTGIGTLDRLPLELIYLVLQSLDLLSIFKLRQVNLGARVLVDSLHEYGTVARASLDAFCALLQTKVASVVPLCDFYSELCSRECCCCGQFGSLIFLPTWSRCCHGCMGHCPQFKMQTLTAVRKQYKVNNAASKCLIALKALPGRYGHSEGLWKGRNTLIQTKQVEKLYQLCSTSHCQIRRFQYWTTYDEKYRCMATCEFPHHDSKSKKVDNPVWCAGCLSALKLGIHSKRSSELEELFRRCKKMYFRPEFLEHFQQCEEAQLLWRKSDEAGIEPAEV